MELCHSQRGQIIQRLREMWTAEELEKHNLTSMPDDELYRLWKSSVQILYGKLSLKEQRKAGLGL